MKKLVLTTLLLLWVSPTFARDVNTAAANWAGAYVGGSVDYFSQKSRLYIPASGFRDDGKLDGASFSAQFGYLYPLNSSFLIGAEIGISFPKESKDIPADAFFGQRLIVDRAYDAKLIVGHALADVLIYASAGHAWSRVGGCRYDLAFGNCPLWFDQSTLTKSIVTGWSVGAGIVWKVSGKLAARIEYQFSEFDYRPISTPNVGNGNIDLKPTNHTVRLGLVWQLGRL